MHSWCECGLLRCPAVGGKGIKEAAGDAAPEARTAKDAEAKAEDDVEVSPCCSSARTAVEEEARATL